jgi:hypothetical protein
MLQQTSPKFVAGNRTRYTRKLEHTSSTISVRLSTAIRRRISAMFLYDQAGFRTDNVLLNKKWRNRKEAGRTQSWRNSHSRISKTVIIRMIVLRWLHGRVWDELDVGTGTLVHFRTKTSKQGNIFGDLELDRLKKCAQVSGYSPKAGSCEYATNIHAPYKRGNNGSVV